jgi:hypothetical protein
MRTSFAVVLLSLSLLVTGCGGNDADCVGHLDDTGSCQPQSECRSDLDCMAPNGLCDTTKGMCVPCTPANATACVDTTPVCGGDDRCRACAAHDECSSNACLLDGSCAMERDVAYVAPGGSGNTCGRDSPCGTLAAALAIGTPVIKMAAGLVKDNQTTTIDGRAVTIVAEPGAVLSRDGEGVVLEIKNDGADVQISDLEITGQTGKTGILGAIVLDQNAGIPKLTLTRTLVDGNQSHGIFSAGSLTVTQSTIFANQGDGISSSSNVLLTVTQSTISANQGPGIVSDGPVTVTQSTISANRFGGIASVTGAPITVSQSTISANQGDGISSSSNVLLTVSQSTISANQGIGISSPFGGSLTMTQSTISANSVAGISMPHQGVFVIVNNFIHHNGNTTAGFGGLDLTPKPGSRVEFNTIIDNQAGPFSDVAGGLFCDTPNFVAANNIIFRNIGGSTGKVQTFGRCTYGNSFVMPASATDNTPIFAHPNSKPYDYHLTPSTPSTIRGAASPCSGVDFDNEPRPSAACDLGADEL